MNYSRVSFAWLATFSLLIGPAGLEGCGSKTSEPAAVIQQAANTPESQQAPAASVPNQATGQQATDQGQQIQLPDVNLTPAGLDELLAPIALYPDPVLAVMLQASVDPQQVMDGGNWLVLDQNQNLKEAALDQASKAAGFTPVMQALLHYPTVVDMMCQQFDWTKQLGAAYQADPKAVLDSVQRLRAVAVDNGALKSSPQMKVDVTQQQGQQVVQLEPTNPKVVYVPQYDPQQVYSSTTMTTAANGTTTTTTTTSGPAPSTSTNNTVVVQQQQSGVSTGTAVLIGLLSFGAGIAVGAAINNNNYYYPSWGYGGVYYGGRPYYPPPYYPHYGGGWGPSYGYHRPVHYGNTNIYVNNNNYYNRFNNNANLRPNYKPMPVHYNNRPNGVYANSVGNRPGANKGVNYTRPATYPSNQPRPGNAANNVQPRPGNTQQRPAGNNANNWKGQTTYQGRQPGAANAQNRPSTGNVQTRPGGVNTGATTRPGSANPPVGQGGANNKFGNKNVDRGYGQNAGGRQNVGNTTPATRPSAGNTAATRPATGNTAANRPATTNTPAARPVTQPASRPQTQPHGAGAFGGANNASADRAASNRGRASMGAPQQKNGGNKQAATRKR
jgi:Protein of unknown function (DUF3300)